MAPLDPEKQRAYNRGYYRRNREKQLAAAKRWRRENPERAREYQRQWSKDNAERVRGYAKGKPRKHVRTEAARQAERRYREKEKQLREQGDLAAIERQRVRNEGKRVAKHKRRVAEGEFSKEEWLALKESGCLRCGKREPDVKLVPDHVTPVSKGGSGFIENIQPLCIWCNTSKGAKIIDYRIPVSALG